MTSPAPLTPAAQAAILKALMDVVKGAYEQARAGADTSLRALNEEAGVTTVEVRVPGCTRPVAKLSLSTDEVSVAVDQPAMLAWCKERYPDEVMTEVVTVEQVRPAFAGVLMKRLVVDGDVIIDPGPDDDPFAGEAIRWARVVPGKDRSTLTFTPKTGRAAIAEAWASGQLAIPPLLALPPAP